MVGVACLPGCILWFTVWCVLRLVTCWMVVCCTRVLGLWFVVWFVCSCDFWRGWVYVVALVWCGFWVLCAMVVFSGFLMFDMCLLVDCAWFCFWFGTAIWAFLGLACVRVFVDCRGIVLGLRVLMVLF